MKSFLKFFDTYLEPSDRLSEVLFGLIMVISIISTVNYMLAGGETVRDLLIAAIGCNTAWGIVDGVLYVLKNVLQRSQRNVIIKKVWQAKTPEEALAMIGNRLDPMINPLLDASEKDRFYRAIYKKISQAHLETGRLLKEDLMGAMASFILVFLSTFPVAIPFIVISDPQFALKISYLIGLIMLFIVGYRWGQFAMVKPLRPAFGMMLLGILLIVVTIALGG